MSNRTATHTTGRCTLPDGRTLAYTTCGSANGTPVIAHHGTPGSRLFSALLSETASDAGIRLIVPDRPGYGKSSPPPDGWTWRQWQRDLQNLLKEESIDEASVLGFSGGGPFALAATNTDWATRVALVSGLVPPVESGLATLSEVSLVLRLVFRLTHSFARIAGSKAVVGQYTDRPVSEAVAEAVTADFHEAFRQGAKAVTRETRLFTTNALESVDIDDRVRAWHGTRDSNAPLSSVRSLTRGTEGTLVTKETDHLGVLLDCRRDVLEWVGTA